MALFASIKKTLDQNADCLSVKQGFFADVAYAINRTVADLTPDTAYGSTTDHFKMAAQSLSETLKAAGGGIKLALWNKKNVFVRSIIEKSGCNNPAGQAALATFYTGLYYLKAFTYDAVIDTAKGFHHGVRAISRASGTEEALSGAGQFFGSIGAAAGMAAGMSSSAQIASKIGNISFVVPMLNGPEAVLATVAIPAGSFVAGVAPGGVGIAAMSATEGASGGGEPKAVKDADESVIKTPADLQRELRRRGLSKTELANALGIRPSAISNWMALDKIPFSRVKEIAEFLKSRRVAVDDLPIGATAPQATRHLNLNRYLQESVGGKKIAHVTAVKERPSTFVAVTADGEAFEVSLVVNKLK